MLVTKEGGAITLTVHLWDADDVKNLQAIGKKVATEIKAKQPNL